MRLDWTPCSLQPPQTHRPHQIKKKQRWSHLSGSKRISLLKFFFRWYTSVLFSGSGDAQNTELDLTPVFSFFHHRTWPMRLYWPLVRRLKWPISWLCRRRRPNSTRTCPLQSSSKPSPAGQCPSLGPVFGNQQWVGLNISILKAFSLFNNISDDLLHLCEIYSFRLQLFGWCWYLCDYLN